MDHGLKVEVPTGWKYEGWRACKDLDRAMGGIPRYLRCMRCYRLVTHGDVSLGGCICGNRKLNPANGLTWVEIALLKMGWFRLKDWEIEAIHPLLPFLVRVRERILKVKNPAPSFTTYRRP
jgi:hypothetical protein